MTGVRGRARVILRGSYRFKVRLAQHLGNDFALGPSRVGRAVPAIARIRWRPQAALPQSGCAGDTILDVASYTKKPGAEERIFPDYRCCLSNFLITYDLRREVFPWLFMPPTDPVSPLKAASSIRRVNKGPCSRPIGTRSRRSYYSNGCRCNRGHKPSHR